MRFLKLVKAHAAATRQALALVAVLTTFAITARLSAQQPPEVKPGPEHAFLKEGEGVWDATAKSMGGESKGELRCQMALNGLWLLELYKGEAGGQAFEGRGATSYDPAKKKFVNVWIDSMVPSPMLSEGTYDKQKKTLTLVGTMPLPVDVQTLPLYLWECCRGCPIDPVAELHLVLPFARAATLLFWGLLL